jgi:hypothetical protein
MSEEPAFVRVGSQVRPANRAGLMLVLAVVFADLVLVGAGALAMIATGDWVWLVVPMFTGSVLMAVFIAWLWMKAVPKPKTPPRIVTR